LIVSDEGLENLGFATPCEPGLLAGVVPGATAEPVSDATVSPDTKIYEVRFGWEPLFRAESHPATGNIQRLVIWTPNALTPAGITIGQRFEHAARRTRATWSFEAGDEEFAGALVGTLSGSRGRAALRLGNRGLHLDGRLSLVGGPDRMRRGDPWRSRGGGSGRSIVIDSPHVAPG